MLEYGASRYQLTSNHRRFSQACPVKAIHKVIDLGAFDGWNVLHLQRFNHPAKLLQMPEDESPETEDRSRLRAEN